MDGNDLMAAQLFTSSANRNNADALFNLGIYHERGKGGVERSDIQAEICFRKSADQVRGMSLVLIKYIEKMLNNYFIYHRVT